MKHRSLMNILVVLVSILSAAAAWAQGLEGFASQEGVLRISGGTAHIPVMKEAARRVMASNAQIQITIAGGGSGAGIKQVGEGLVDIGNSGRKPSEEEAAKYGLTMTKWAIDGVCAIVNPGSPVKALSSDQLQQIYAGKISSWKELGGEDRSINIYTRDKASGTREVFWKKALAKGEITAKAQFVASNGAMKSAVANDPYAIGYMSVGYVDESVAPVVLDGVTPSLETVKNGSFKVARGLYSNTRGQATGLARVFIDYLLSPEGQQIAADKGFIPVN